MQLLNDLSWGYTDGRDEELGAGLDDDVDELGKLALGVIVAVGSRLSERSIIEALG
jgi:hypothetical protein